MHRRIHIVELVRAIRHWVADGQVVEPLAAPTVSAMSAFRDELCQRGVEASKATQLTGDTFEVVTSKPEHAVDFMNMVRPK